MTPQASSHLLISNESQTYQRKARDRTSFLKAAAEVEATNIAKWTLTTKTTSKLNSSMIKTSATLISEEILLQREIITIMQEALAGIRAVEVSSSRKSKRRLVPAVAKSGQIAFLLLSSKSHKKLAKRSIATT
jgi:hypothetical protein